MRYFLLALFGALFLIQGGCERPDCEPQEYGTIVYTFPDIPDAKKPFPLPEIEGINTEAIQEQYEKTRNRPLVRP